VQHLRAGESLAALLFPGRDPDQHREAERHSFEGIVSMIGGEATGLLAVVRANEILTRAFADCCPWRRDQQRPE